MITIREALSFAGLRLKKEGGQSSALDVAVLLGFVTGLNRAELYRNWQRVLTPEEENRFDNLLTRRAAGEPVAYLTGRKEFMGLEFYVTPTVLIPRPETELMVEKAVSLLDNDGGILVDAGTGSGAIAVSLAVMLPRTVIYATDISLLALEIAGKNSRKHGVERRVFLRQGDLLASLTEDNLAGKIDLVAANLPYIETAEMTDLPKDVQLYEPWIALEGGVDGLDLYRRLIPEAAVLLKPGGYLLMEIGSRQREGIFAMLNTSSWTVNIIQDLAGLDRLVIAKLCKQNT